METLQRILFESPLYVYVSLAIAEFVIFAMWYERRSRRVARALLIPPVLVLLTVGIEAAVVTDREEISGALNRIADQAETAPNQPPRVDALRSILAQQLDADLGAGYGGSDLNRTQVLQSAQRVLDNYPVRSVRLLNMQIEVQDTIATSRFTSLIELHDSNFGVERTSLIWNITWEETDDGWKIVHVERPETGVDL